MSPSSSALLRQLLAVALGAAGLLLIPLVAMQFTDEVAWTASDFIAAACLLGGAGLLYVLAARLARTGGQRAALGLAVAALLLLVWAELAVGLFGTPLAGS